ncbi:MAG: type II secretion system ATPase GspE [Minwuiales bacterium]|nr:type II secretion system ATPase GspE [Minwuiales bacterium]
MQVSEKKASQFERSICERLIEQGKLDQQGLQRAQRLQAESGERLYALLPKLGLVSERDVAETLAACLALPLANGNDFPDEPMFEGRLSSRFLGDSLLLPLSQEAEGLRVAMADPLDDYASNAIRLIAKSDVLRCVAEPAELEAAIDRLYRKKASGARADETDISGADKDSDLELDVERLKDLASEAPVIRLVNQLINQAIDARASDIHIEPFDRGMRVRYRIDGGLRDMEAPPSHLSAAIVSRIKILARLNIAERRLPQDGRIKLTNRGTPIDLRVSTLPTMFGEGVVLRILDRKQVSLDFADLGVKDKSLELLVNVIEQPHGIFLVTGPTGSGKTTTLYTALQRLNQPDLKIVTVEDPIEYQLEGINQIQVKPNIELTFASILPNVLRHDPDIIMVGEIRDVETAEIAIQAALTGHLVLSTLHTNDSVGAVARLLDMGVKDYLLTSTLNGVASQRLVRTLCPHCRKEYDPLPELIEQLGLSRYSPSSDITLFRPTGCRECGGTGYFGRICLMELFVVSEDVRRLVLSKTDAGQLRRLAISEGMQTMYDDGMRKALAGLTTVEEVMRVARGAS